MERASKRAHHKKQPCREYQEWLAARKEAGLSVATKESIRTFYEPVYLNVKPEFDTGLHQNVLVNVILPLLDWTDWFPLMMACRQLYCWIHPQLVMVARDEFGPQGTPMALSLYASGAVEEYLSDESDEYDESSESDREEQKQQDRIDKAREWVEHLIEVNGTIDRIKENARMRSEFKEAKSALYQQFSDMRKQHAEQLLTPYGLDVLLMTSWNQFSFKLYVLLFSDLKIIIDEVKRNIRVTNKYFGPFLEDGLITRLSGALQINPIEWPLRIKCLKKPEKADILEPLLDGATQTFKQPEVLRAFIVWFMSNDVLNETISRLSTRFGSNYCIVLKKEDGTTSFSWTSELGYDLYPRIKNCIRCKNIKFYFVW